MLTHNKNPMQRVSMIVIRFLKLVILGVKTLKLENRVKKCV